MANAKMSGVNLSLANLVKSQLNNSDLSIGNFIFGLGPGGWGKQIALSDYSFPHNIIIESILEHGIMGAIFIFTVISTGFRQFYKRIGKINSNLYMNILVFFKIK